MEFCFQNSVGTLYLLIKLLLLLFSLQHLFFRQTAECVQGFMFLEKSFFPEVVSALGNLPDFYSPVNPTAFHQVGTDNNAAVVCLVVAIVSTYVLNLCLALMPWHWCYVSFVLSDAFKKSVLKQTSCHHSNG